jgi:hypothetical protein
MTHRAEVRLEQIVAGLPEPQWDIVVAEQRTHTIRRPDGGGPTTLDDVVVHARRRAATQS